MLYEVITIASFDPVDLYAGMFDDEHLLERLDDRVFCRPVDVRLQRDCLAATYTLVGRDDDVGLAVATPLVSPSARPS